MKLSVILWLMLMLFLVPVPAAKADGAAVMLEAVARAMDTGIADWELALDGRTFTPYSPGQSVTTGSGVFQAVFTVPPSHAGQPVTGTECRLVLEMYARGEVEIVPRCNGREYAPFVIPGGELTGQEFRHDIVIANELSAGRVEVQLSFHNRGLRPFRTEFWPPRKSPLPDEQQNLILRGARLDFPAAAGNNQAVIGWLTSMQTAQGLLNPELKRYTFIGDPYDIPDARNIPAGRLAALRDNWADAVLALDLAALQAGDWPAVAASLQHSYDLAGPLREYAREFKVYLIGNAHIDIAWLWRMAETKQVARNTFDTVLTNMTEYPELRYAQSQALTYQWMEREYPELFERIRRRIKDGSWEVVGGMWVEPDCNLISGESWVRQLLYGKKYFREKFGVDVRIGWNPDSFGYNWNMPQIYGQSGIDCFITQKIWWNDTTVFPFFTFWWEGVDGSRLLTYFPPMGYTSRVRLPRVVDAITKYQATTGYQKSLILYGLGDHGGGPNREILDRVRSYEKLFITPEFIHSPAASFLDHLEKDLGATIPVWNDELYLEYHRGTYTTQAYTKKQNRRSESGLGAAEKWATIAWLLGERYPAAELETAWKRVLTNQFHDILPGSSITPVYRDAAADYSRAAQAMTIATEAALATIAARVDTSAVMGIPVLVFNSLAWPRSDFVQVALPAGHDQWRLLDHAGNELPLEVAAEPAPGRLMAGFVAEEVPSVGYRLYELRPEAPRISDQHLHARDLTLENTVHRLTVDSRTGHVISLFDKRLQREFVPAGGAMNVLQAFEDRPENWDAWNIGYTGRMWTLDSPDQVSLVHQSPVRAVIRVKKSFLGLDKSRYSPTEDFPSSFFIQDIILYRAMDRIDIQTTADWWETHVLLKAAFPTMIRSDRATYEIPFAAISRSTRRETMHEKARFEVPALRWADLSDAAGGLSLLNDSKYGYDIHDSNLRLSLLRAPTWPDPVADRGQHEFTYSLYTHPGGWNDGATVRRGRELNTPLQATLPGQHGGILPAEMSFFTLTGEGIVLESVKLAEDGTGLILRLYESSGRGGSATLRPYRTPDQVWETDLMENPRREMAFTTGAISLEFIKFEIKSLKMIF
ncbi:MAG: alpha-mannosidase [Acidobacteria bacterium]|nr:alpha-mannosidase [Acidobacteriota bacterium]